MRFEPADRGLAELGHGDFEASRALVHADGGRTWRGSVGKITGRIAGASAGATRLAAPEPGS